MAQFKRISLSQLRPIVEYYLSHLSGWEVVKKDSLARTTGPIAQFIGFERLADSTYRPVGYIRVLCAPDVEGAMELPRHLNVHVRQVSQEEHERMRERVLDAMISELTPDVRNPLQPGTVLSIYENEAIPKSDEAFSLSALNAYMGDIPRAQYWSSRFNELVDSLESWEDWDEERRAFLDSLERWMRDGSVKEELQRIIAAERKKLGFE